MNANWLPTLALVSSSAKVASRRARLAFPNGATPGSAQPSICQLSAAYGTIRNKSPSIPAYAAAIQVASLA